MPGTMTNNNNNQIKVSEDEPKPWEQQPTESKKNYDYFKIYLGLSPPRTHKQLQEKLKENKIKLQLNTLQQLSATHNWTSRTHAYDDYMTALFFESEAAAITEMKTRHLKDVREAQDKLKLFEEKIYNSLDKLELSKLSYCLDVLTRCKDKMMRYERLSLGESTEHIRRTDNSFEALKAAIDLSAKRLEGQVQKSESKKDSKKPDAVIDVEFSKK